jgi:hypothetical protein
MAMAMMPFAGDKARAQRAAGLTACDRKVFQMHWKRQGVFLDNNGVLIGELGGLKGRGDLVCPCLPLGLLCRFGLPRREPLPLWV